VQIFRLHALNISTGAEKYGGPVEIAAGSFNAAMENQRAAVTLVNGVVYLAFGSHEDYTPYHGFVLGYSASTLQQVQVFNVTPNGGQGAIWMGGQGLVADSFNNLYAITANSSQSSENSADDYGESFIKLVPNGNSLTLADYFKPNQYDSWNASDSDLGSTGAFAIPGTSYIAGGSKSGLFFVVNTNNMGKLDFSSNQSHQEFQATNGLWGSPAFFNNVMYIWGVNEPLKAYQWNGSDFDTSPASQSTYSPPGGTTSGTVSVSSNGTTAGTTIVWGTAPTADPDHATVGGNLYAYDATPICPISCGAPRKTRRATATGVSPSSALLRSPTAGFTWEPIPSRWRFTAYSRLPARPPRSFRTSQWQAFGARPTKAPSPSLREPLWTSARNRSPADRGPGPDPTASLPGCARLTAFH